MDSDNVSLPSGADTHSVCATIIGVAVFKALNAAGLTQTFKGMLKSLHENTFVGR